MRTSREANFLPRHKSVQKIVGFLRVLLITNAWGCRAPAVPQEALDVTVRTRDSHRHGAKTRASSGALLEAVMDLRHHREIMFALSEWSTHLRGRDFPRP